MARKLGYIQQHLDIIWKSRDIGSVVGINGIYNQQYDMVCLETGPPNAT